VLQVGPADWRLFVCWLATIVPFAFATWEEYFTGKLVLAPVNGPSDGECTRCARSRAVVNNWASFDHVESGSALVSVLRCM